MRRKGLLFISIKQHYFTLEIFMALNFRIAFLSGIIFILTGCSATLPNAKPLVDSSMELEKSSEVSFQVVEDTSATILKNLDPNDKTARHDYENIIIRINAEEATRIVFLNAVVDYSLALQKIINNTESENKKIQEVANSIDSLINEVEKNATVAGPYAPMVTASAEVAKPLNHLTAMLRQDVNTIRTARSLDQAVKAAGPLFNKIAVTFQKDLSSLSKSVDYAPDTLFGVLWIRHQDDKEYREDLLRARIEITHRIRNYGVIGSNYDKRFSYDMAFSDGVYGGKNNFAVLQSIDKQLELSKPIFDQLDTEVAENISKVTTAKQLIKKSNETLAAFGKAHADFAQALKDGVSVDFSRLEDYAKQLKILRELLIATQTISKKSN
jgi:hypothetical protein